MSAPSSNDSIDNNKLTEVARPKFFCESHGCEMVRLSLIRWKPCASRCGGREAVRELRGECVTLLMGGRKLNTAPGGTQ